MDDSILVPIIDRALDEDLPDITSDAIFGASEYGVARVIVKEDGVIAASRVIELTTKRLDSSSAVELLVSDGDDVAAGTVIATVTGSVRSLLAAERTLLNLLQRASGVATFTRRYVRAIEGTGAEILDTRKTIPGLRLFDKAAVSIGGGSNHRLGLHDMFLIKDNHVDRAGSVRQAISRVRESGLEHPLMIEVRTIEELDQALALEPDYILLDNMDLETMTQAVRRRDGFGGRRPLLEASGGVRLDTVRQIALTGVDRISVGSLTHSAPALDISMKIVTSRETQR
ncbi:MAG: carboxylating nicotinate-nucleotide diphosphorylase [Thermoanaerobaculia bacterium]|nr:carboxylating nicotinate-nucleotide diphosphorylase [Thermoanaerobaculia bacterium]